MHFLEYQCSNYRTYNFQADDEGSIPFTRSNDFNNLFEFQIECFLEARIKCASGGGGHA
jgi:hypothetical protein